MANKISKSYRIRDKRTGKFIHLGYNGKSIWNAFPTAVINFDQETGGRKKIDNKENFEIVVFELRETGEIFPIK